MHQNLIRRLLFASLGLLIGTLAAAPAPTAPPPGETTGEVVQLSPFEVDGSRDKGYTAESTLSGSRLNMALDDVAQSVAVFTPQFLEDIGAENVNDILLYAVNSEPYLEEDKLDSNNQIGSEISFRPNGSSNIRGQMGSVTVDYMASGGDADTYNTSRAELSQGPNAILFGFGGAGGVLNFTTESANLQRESLRLRSIVGSWGKRRFELNANRPIIKQKLGVRLMALADGADSWRKDGWSSQRRATLSATYRPLKNTNINASFEKARTKGSFSIAQGAQDGYSEWVERIGSATYPFGRDGTTAALVNGSPGLLDANGLIRGQNARAKVHIDNLDLAAAGLPANAGNVFPFRDLPKTQPLTARRMLSDAEAKIDQFQVFGPFAYRTQDIRNFKLTLDQRIRKDLFLNLAFFDSENIAYDISPNGRDVVIQADPLRSFDGVINGSPLDNVTNPFAPAGGDYWFFSEQSWVQKTSTINNRVLRASLAYELGLGEKWGRHQFALSGEQKSFERSIIKDREIIDIYAAQAAGVNGATWDLNYNNPNDNRNLLFRRHYFRPGDSSEIRAGNNEPVIMNAGGAELGSIWVANDASGRRHITSDVDSTMFSMVNYWFKNRLTTTWGYRKNAFVSDLYNGVRDPATQAFKVSDVVSETTEFERSNRTFGAVLRVRPWLALTYNQGDNQEEPDFFALVLPDGRLPPGASGEARDYGVRFRLLDNRVALNLSYFESTQLNVRNGARIAEVLLEPHRALWNSFEAVQNDLGFAAGDARRFSLEEYEIHNATGANNSLMDKESSGFDVRVITNLTPNWSLVFNYSKTLETKRTNLYREAYPWMDGQIADARKIYDAYVAANDGSATALIAALGAEETRLNERFLAEADFGNAAISPVDRVYNYALQEMAVVRDEVEGYSIGISPQKANLFTSYRFTEGRLKGFTTGGGFSWRNGRNLNRFFTYNVGTAATPELRDFQTPQRDFGPLVQEIRYRSDDELRLKVMFGYQTRTGLRFLGNPLLKLQLNVDNLLQNDYELEPLQYTAGGVISKYLIVEPRSFRLTATLEF
ncbi:MAG: hypothetical protein Q7S40_01230 [Opitutaceae bacterium]|nr:hypothetical protein [Opitutaceae bacterium]